MNSDDFIVFLVDDDPGVLKALTSRLEAKSYMVRAFPSARQFLAEHDATVPGCAIFDVSMPELDGLELQAALAAKGVERPIIFITGVGEVRTSVKAMKAGAIDFLAKPVKSNELLAAIELAREREKSRWARQHEASAVDDRLSSLTRREKEVLSLVISGLLNKQIAARLGIAEKTIKLHRGRMMHKVGVRSVAELVRIADKAGIRPLDADA